VRAMWEVNVSVVKSWVVASPSFGVRWLLNCCWLYLRSESMGSALTWALGRQARLKVRGVRLGDWEEIIYGGGEEGGWGGGTGAGAGRRGGGFSWAGAISKASACSCCARFSKL